MKRMRILASLVPVLALSWAALPAQEGKFEPPPSKPNLPAEEQKAFQLAKGIAISLVASEPNIVDPVALAFDARGRLFVAEMHGYPNGGVGTGAVVSGKIKMLEDTDGDGVFEKATVFAEGLRLPTSIMPYKDGLLVANAPDLILLRDTDGDGKADEKRILYTGFDLANIQQMVNSLQWGLDNWVHGTCGGKGGTVTCPEDKSFKPLLLRGRGIRFHPDIPGSLQPTSGGGQFGLTPDEAGFWFTATNSQVLRHIVLPDHYLARNPNLLIAATTLDIHTEGSAPKVHRVSPFESWRVERTRRRKGGPDSKRFATTELVPGGFITSACSPTVYLGGLFPDEFKSDVFVCDPANNLIHRMIVDPKGSATFTAKRAYPDREFLASTDNWFRPVNMTIGPDGALYVADFYREVIETPLSLPEDMKKVLVLESRKRGRIWRIAPESTSKPDLEVVTAKTTDADLVKRLESPNIWQRYTAQRLLVERKAVSQKPALEDIARNGKSAAGRIHGLWTLEGIGALEDADIADALSAKDASVLIHGLRLSETRLDKAPLLLAAAVRAAGHDSPRVRFQAAFTLGASTKKEAAAALAGLAQRDGADGFMQTAILSSAGGRGADFVAALLQDGKSAAPASLLSRLAQMTASSGNDAEAARLLETLQLHSAKLGDIHFTVLDGLVQGWQARGLSADSLWTKGSPTLKKALEPLRGLLVKAGEIAADEKQPLAERQKAIRLLGIRPLKENQKTLVALLTPSEAPPLQLAAVRALSQYADAQVAPLLLEEWRSYSPTIRREVVEALLARPQRVALLLDAIQAKKVQPALIEPARLEQLRNHPDAGLRKRAVKLLAAQVLPERAKILADYQMALDLKGDVAKGRMIFRKNCITCHRLEETGLEVGADLRSILPGKTPERLLVDILDPSREVDPRFQEYYVLTKSGRAITGIIAAESAGGLTLRRAEKTEETLLRSDIDSIQATTRSLMPDGLERMIGRQELADLIAYLLEVGRKK